VDVLSVIHGTDARTELFGPVIEAAGHALDEWSFAWGTPPPRPLESYDCVLVFGGAMHPDEDARHNWLVDEIAWLRAIVERGTPLLGVCLGAQLVARAMGSWVGRVPAGPEIGWWPVALTEAGVDDAVLGSLPREFVALQWHTYTYGLPDGAVELATTPACTQAFRLGETCWGVQFHPEVTAAQVGAWIVDPDDPPLDEAKVRAETPRYIGRWNELGRTLCRAFLASAEQALARAA
jgi:GMP synthase (glutamine-hydrolysing)